MMEVDLMQLHTYVIMNSVPTLPLLREWEAQRAEHDRSRDRPRRGQPFHEFHVWLSQYVNDLVAGGHDVPADVQLLAHPPSPRVLQYRSLWAYGNYIRVEAEGGNAHVTYDCGVV